MSAPKKAAYVREHAASSKPTCPAISPQGYTCEKNEDHEGNHVPHVAHTCHWPGCEKEVPPAMWGCKGHWFKLPQALRNQIWRTYVPGQEISKTPSAAYVTVSQEVQAWIETNVVSK